MATACLEEEALPCLWNCPESWLWAEAMGRNHCTARKEAALGKRGSGWGRGCWQAEVPVGLPHGLAPLPVPLTCSHRWEGRVYRAGQQAQLEI